MKKKLILGFCTILGFFGTIWGQKIPVKNIEQVTIDIVNEYYDNLNYAASPKTNRQYRWSTVKPLFAEDAKIEVLSKRRKFPIIRTAEEYFSRVSLLCPSMYDSVTFSARKGIMVNLGAVECEENVQCRLDTEVKQEFKGWKGGKIIYSDCTIRIITVVFNRKGGKLKAKIKYISAETVNNGC